MLATFKETVTSLLDPHYSRHIVSKPLGGVIWYFTKYVISLSIALILTAIMIVTYLIPQSPRLAQQRLPDNYIQIKSGQLFTDLSPRHISSSDSTFVLNVGAALPTLSDTIPPGIYIYQDGLLLSHPNGSYRVQKFTEIPDFYLDKPLIVSWLRSHTFQLWLLITGIILVVGLIGIAFFLSSRVVMLSFWAALLWVFSRLFRRRHSFINIFKIAVYAAVPSLLLSAVLSIASNQWLSYLNLILFGYLSISWLINLKPTK